MIHGEQRQGRTVRFDRYGGPEVLVTRLQTIPDPGPGEVLVRVHASGLNPKDAMIRSGTLRLQTGRAFPRGTGFDFAGEVVLAGSGVPGFDPKTRVWGFLDGVMGGTAADYVLVPQGCLARMPESLGWLEAAALPLVASTALQALRDVAGLRPHERVLVRGAAGGVGSAAIQIARVMGAHTTAIATGEGIGLCRSLGADEVIDYRISGPATSGGRFDVFLDCVGGSSLGEYGRLLAPGGRWVTVAPNLSIFALTPLSRLLPSVLPFPRFGFVVVRPVAADLAELGRLVDLDRLSMPISTVYALDGVRKAHEDLRAGHARGKRVLAISPAAIEEAELRGLRQASSAGEIPVDAPSREKAWT